MTRVAVVGTGYVGLVTGTCLAEMGNHVVCHDVDRDKIARLARGELPIYEPGLEELLRRNQRGDRLSFSAELAGALEGAEVAIIAVGTPPSEDGSADRRHVLGVARDIGEIMQEPLVMAVKSTVPVGTCDRVRDVTAEVLARRGVEIPFSVVSNPEFLKEGAAVADFMRPDRIVVGADSAAAFATMRQLYAAFLRNGHPIVETDVRSSEMTKYAANVILATRISLMNELALICDRVNADILEVWRGVVSDARIGRSFLYPGIGYGGSCFPKDVRALSRMAVETDCPADILDAVEKVNRHQKLVLANRLIMHFGGDVRGRHVAVWGLSFKPNTDDVREAPALAIIKRLSEAGATLSVYDPEAMANAREVLKDNEGVRFAESCYEAVQEADALVLATEWGEFRNPDFERVLTLMRTPVVFDGRNQYDPERMRELGFSYYGVGRPTVAPAMASRCVAPQSRG